MAEVEDLTAKLDSFVVTPPSSSEKHTARPRVDSVRASPTPPKGSDRKRSPYGWPPRYDVPRTTVVDGSEEDD